MKKQSCCLLLLLALGPLAQAQDCPWLPDGRMDEAYPRMAPWSTLAGGVGRCKFISTGRRPNNVCPASTRNTARVASETDLTVDPRLNRTGSRVPRPRSDELSCRASERFAGSPEQRHTRLRSPVVSSRERSPG